MRERAREPELTNVYNSEPAKTMPAPTVSSAFHPFPNHQTLMHRLIALRAVSTRFVDTDVTRCRSGSASVLRVSGRRAHRGELVHGGDTHELGDEVEGEHDVGRVVSEWGGQS